MVKRISAVVLAAVMIVEMLSAGMTSVAASDINLSIIASKTTLTIYEELNLTYECDKDVSASEISWNSSDKNVVSVSDEGKIKGLKAGAATITLTIDGTYNDSIEINVRPLTDYRLKSTSGTVTFSDGIECLGGTATFAMLYQDNNFGTMIELEEGVFSTDVTMPSSGGFRLMFGRTDSANYYSFRVLQNGWTNIYKTSSGTENQMVTRTLDAFTPGQVYNVKVVMKKDGTSLKIDCFINDEFWGDYTDESPLAGKYVGVRLNTNVSTDCGYFTNFYVSSFTDNLTAGEIESVIEKVYDYTAENMYSYNNNWVEATYYLGVIEAFRATGNEEYYNSAYDCAEAFAWKAHQNMLTTLLDDIAVGLVYAELHSLCDEEYNYKLESVKKEFDYNVSLGEYDYSWIDEIYMGGYTAEYLSKVTGDSKYSDVNVASYKKWHEKLFDEEDGLWYRDSRYVWGSGSLSTSSNGLKVFWSRGNAWVYVSLAQQLRTMDSNHSAYETYVSDFKKMSVALMECQRADGFWNSNLADPNEVNGRETTGTGGFLYGLATGIELGLLDYDTYYPVAKKAYEGLSSYAVKSTGEVGYCQQIGWSPAAATTEDTNFFGIGLFLMGASKMMTLCEDYESATLNVTYAEHDPEKAICDIEEGYYTGGYESIVAANVSYTESGNGVENLMNFNWGGGITGARWSAIKSSSAEFAEVMITFNETLSIEQISMVAFEYRAYAFSIETSVDRENWITVADNMQGQIVSSDHYMTRIVLEEPVTAHYLRLRVKECLNASTSWISMKGLILYAEPVESDDVSNKRDLSGAYTWASDAYDVFNSAAAAFDGDMDTRWCARGADAFPSTLSVDLGGEKDITKINTYFEQDSEWEYTLYVSTDGEEWMEFGSNPENIPKQQNYTNENEVKGRYVKLEISGAGLDPDGNPCWSSVWELEVYGNDENINLAYEMPCAADSTYSVRTSAAAAFDGDVNTRYCASSSEMPQTLMADLGKVTLLESVYLLFEQYSNYEYTIDISEDGDEWTTFAASSGESVFGVTHHGEAEARYLRLVITGSTNGAWASVREVEVYTNTNITEDINGAKIKFRGASLRMDYEEYDKTSLRFGYQIYLPEGATLNSWSWQYTTTNPNNPSTGIGLNKTVESDGGINANLVITGIPSSYYGLILTAKMKIEYTLSDGTVCSLEETVVKERSVNQVAENILVSEDGTQAEKDYATNILK